MDKPIVHKKVCSVDGCETVSLNRGYCSKHYQRVRRYGSPLISKCGRENKSQFCSVAGCQLPRCSRGMCQKHYLRVKNHGSTEGFSERFRKKILWIEANSSYAGDDCLKWPFGVGDHGRGIVTISGSTVSAPRAMCKSAHGEPPAPYHQAAHSCGNGHLGCMNPKHLRWATVRENELDKIIHGTVRRGSDINTAKVTAEEVIQIREMAGSVKVRLISERFGISKVSVANIIARKSWAWL